MDRIYRLGLTWILVCMVSIFGTVWAYGEEPDTENIDLKALTAVLTDAETGRVLYDKNADAPMAMASTTKIMTCLVILENAELDEVVTVSDYAASMPDVQLNAVSGDAFYIEDLLYALMLESHNDVAVALAEHVGGSEKDFSEMMNCRAKEMGCTNTKFVTANGLDAENHYTTARDLAQITIEALKNEIFLKIIQTSEYSFENISGTRSYYVSNKNSFLNQMEGAYGVKTGFTNNAGYCFVGAVVQDEKNLVSVVLGSGWPPNKEWKWTDTIKLMNYGFSNFSYRKINPAKIDVGTLLVEDGVQSCAMLKTDSIEEKLLMSETDKLTVNIVKEFKRKAPVNEGEVVGWIDYQINNESVKKYPIYIEHTIMKKTYADYLKQVFRCWTMF